MPLEDLSNLAQDVYMPMLCNTRNQEGWPEVISLEVMESLNNFVSITQVVVGSTKGNTILPLPPLDVGFDGMSTITNIGDKDKVRSLPLLKHA